ncbi:MAG: hypothetical protein JSW39_22330 [Desulfobacterales bacterium]|nr:MAG: hypothetical protein JSW39_22330 [Desulfobacterales bacterium]
MAVVEKFLGKKVEVPDHLRYIAKQGFWAKAEDGQIIFGFTEPALVLAGGVSALDWLVPQGQRVSKGESIVFAITGKILYLEAPSDGPVHFNSVVKENPALIAEDPYGKGWVFKIEPQTGAENEFKQFTDVQGYVASLKTSEGFKNPDGLKGGVSGICKAVYTGIREQKL